MKIQQVSLLALFFLLLGGLFQQFSVVLSQLGKFIDVVLTLILVLVLFLGEQFLLQLQVSGLDDESLLQQLQLLTLVLLLQLLLLVHLRHLNTTS
jgi:hypothetical protein